MALSDSVPRSDTVEEDEDLYDCVENEEAEGDEIYEDLMRTEPMPMPVCGVESRAQEGAWVRDNPRSPNTGFSFPLSA